MTVGIKIENQTMTLHQDDKEILSVSMDSFEKDPRPIAKAILDLNISDHQKIVLCDLIGF